MFSSIPRAFVLISGVFTSTITTSLLIIPTYMSTPKLLVSSYTFLATSASTRSGVARRSAARPLAAFGRITSTTSTTRTRMTPTDSSSTATMTTTAATTIINQSTDQPELPPLDASSKRLFWVRHGEVINPGGDRPVYYGAMDVPLSPLGQAEAAAAGAYLSQYPLSNVFASTLQRAIYGAEQCLQYQQQHQSDTAPSKVVTLEGFKELDRGDWCGKTKDEIGSDMMERFDACDESVTPANGESFPFLKQRVLKARDDALEQMSPGTMGCVVSHLQVTRCIVSDALNIPTNEMVNLKVATASVTCIDYNADGTQTVHFQSFKPDAGLQKAKDGAN